MRSVPSDGEQPSGKSAILQETLQIFESTRSTPAALFESDRFLAYLTNPPASTGLRTIDTFEGRRRYVRFIDSVQLHFGVCFTVKEWERGLHLEDFVELVAQKVANPRQAQRLAQQRLKEARATLRGEPIKSGVYAIPLLVAVFYASELAIRFVVLILWLAIVVGVLSVNVRAYRYAKLLAARIDGRAG